MSKFGAWLHSFMQGRYGFDQLGRSLSTYVVVLWIVSIVCGVLSNVFGVWMAWLSTILNWLGLALLLLMIFRMMSRNVDKRRAENEAYLERMRNKNRNSNRNKNGNRNGSGSSKSVFAKDREKADTQEHTYLSCQFCGQQMRVPTGKGKIAVKCPSCGNKTIINS